MSEHIKILWNKVNKSIYSPLSLDPLKRDTKLEYIHRKIHSIVQNDGPLNRYELLMKCRSELKTSQNVKRHVCDYKRLAEDEHLLLVQSPEEFLESNPREEVGIVVSEHGGYTLFDENMKESYNFKSLLDALAFIDDNPEMREGSQPPVVVVSSTSEKGKSFMFNEDDPRDLGNISLLEAKRSNNKDLKTASVREREAKVNINFKEQAQETLNNIELE